MRAVPYCASEIIDLVFAAAGMVSEDAFIHKKVLAKVLTVLQENAEEESPAELALVCLRAAYHALGVKDPFEKEKARQIRSMRGLETAFTEYLNQAENRLTAGVRLALAACGDTVKALGREDLEEALERRMREMPAIDDTAALVAQAATAESVLFVAGDAGEIVADRFLVAELAKTATVEVAVAARPLLLRATAADAETAGLTSIATVIDPGADMLGLVTDRASMAFNEKLMTAGLVIVKGEVNYQTLAGIDRDLFYIMRCECPAVARELGVAEGAGGIFFRPGMEKKEN